MRNVTKRRYTGYRWRWRLRGSSPNGLRKFTGGSHLDRIDAYEIACENVTHLNVASCFLAGTCRWLQLTSASNPYQRANECPDADRFEYLRFDRHPAGPHSDGGSFCRGHARLSVKVLRAANTTAAADGSLKGVPDAAPINLPEPDFTKNLECRCRQQQEMAIYWW
jgi:hypothetical protein